MKVGINKIVWILVSSNLMFNISTGFLNPILAIFLVESIEGGSATVAGIAMAILWLTKSTFRIPVGYFLDKIKGENDDYYSMIIGFILFSLAHFLYLFAEIPLHVYGIQFIMGLAGAFAFTPWYGLFSRHLDRLHENFEWGVAISITGFGLSGASFLTGIIADTYGFAPIFIISGIVSLIGTILLLLIKKHLHIKMKKGRHHIKINNQKN